MYSEIRDIPTLVDDFIVYKKMLGYKYETEARIMVTFKAYSIERLQNGIVSLDERFMEGWCMPHINESKKSQSNRVSLLKQFAIYLNNKGYCVYVPKSIYNVENKEFIPYIFTDEEIMRILKTVDAIPYHGWTNIDKVFPVLFRVLYGCGLRISEALSLKLKDIDIEKGTLTIYHGKNDKSRLVVMSPTLKDIFTDYMETVLKNNTPDEYVFARRSGKKECINKLQAISRSSFGKHRFPMAVEVLAPACTISAILFVVIG